MWIETMQHGITIWNPNEIITKWKAKTYWLECKIIHSSCNIIKSTEGCKLETRKKGQITHGLDIAHQFRGTSYMSLEIWIVPKD